MRRATVAAVAIIVGAAFAVMVNFATSGPTPWWLERLRPVGGAWAAVVVLAVIAAFLAAYTVVLELREASAQDHRDEPPDAASPAVDRGPARRRVLGVAGLMAALFAAVMTAPHLIAPDSLGSQPQAPPASVTPTLPRPKSTPKVHLSPDPPINDHPHSGQKDADAL